MKCPTTTSLLCNNAEYVWRHKHSDASGKSPGCWKRLRAPHTKLLLLSQSLIRLVTPTDETASFKNLLLELTYRTRRPRTWKQHTMKTYGGVELYLHAFWPRMLDAASSGQRSATPQSGEKEKSVVTEIMPEYNVVSLMLDSFTPGWQRETERGGRG